MTEYDTILKETLRDVTETFAAAHDDLHQAVVRLARAVQSATDGCGTVVLEASEDQNENNEERICYHLVFVVNTRRKRERRYIGKFEVPMHGYPISVLNPQTENAYGEDLAVIRDRNQLDEFIRKMISDKNNPLVAMIAYFLRNRIANPPPADGGDDIPF